MNEDLMAIAFFLRGVISIGGMAAFIILLGRRLSSAECPSCCRRIAKDAFKMGVPCPDCGTELGETDTREPVPTCRECDALSDGIVLWNGETYCRTCIAKRNPRLLEASASNQLTEDMPYSVRKVAWRMFLFVFLALGGFATFLAAFLAIRGNWQGALQVFGVIFLVGSPVIFLWTGAGAVMMPLLRPKVIAWNRQLIVRVGTSLLVAPLEDCTWSEGKLSQMTIWKSAFLLRGRALIVVLPKKVAEEGNRAAVGFTDESLELWRSFFELAGNPQTEPRRSWWSRLKRRDVT